MGYSAAVSLDRCDLFSGRLLFRPDDEEEVAGCRRPLWHKNRDQFLVRMKKEPNQRPERTTQLAAPALIMILMTDFFLGIANRLAPQVQITFLGMPLKSLLALVIVFFGWTLFMHEIVAQGYKALNYIVYLVKQMQPAVS